MHNGVFLDRDGVINDTILNPKTKEYEAPQSENDFELFCGVLESLKELLKLNYKLFLVSNQPDHAKGKTSLENLLSVHKKMHHILASNNVTFCEYYYCYHHPQGIIPEYTKKCECRKPGNFFLKEAKAKYGLDMANSWMIGDRDADIQCGQSLGTKTIMIKQKNPDGKTGQSKPDYIVNNLKEAVEIIKAGVKNASA